MMGYIAVFSRKARADLPARTPRSPDAIVRDTHHLYRLGKESHAILVRREFHVASRSRQGPFALDALRA
jgi:hypothetical protein